MRCLLLIIFILSAFAVEAQKPTRPEIVWAVVHPFKVSGARKISHYAVQKTAELEKQGTLKDGAGGQLDAFRHTYWMATLSQYMGERRAVSLGRAHEKGNYIQFKKNIKEDNVYVNEKFSVMDLLNNPIGARLGKELKYCSDSVLTSIIIEKIGAGELNIMLKNCDGELLTCEGRKAIYTKGVWESDACIVPSNRVVDCD